MNAREMALQTVYGNNAHLYRRPEYGDVGQHRLLLEKDLVEILQQVYEVQLDYSWCIKRRENDAILTVWSENQGWYLIVPVSLTMENVLWDANSMFATEEQMRVSAAPLYLSGQETAFQTLLDFLMATSSCAASAPDFWQFYRGCESFFHYLP